MSEPATEERPTKRVSLKEQISVLAERMDARDADVKRVADALEKLSKAQEKEERAPEGSKQELKAEKEVETAEENVEAAAEKAGLSDEDINRIADVLWARWDGKEAEETAAAEADAGKSELQKLSEGQQTTEEAPAAEQIAAAPEVAAEEPKDDVPKKKHWSQRKLFGGGDG